MIDEGYNLTDVTIEDDQTISLRGVKDIQQLPDINQLEV
jgi:hypothetical protein